MPACIADAGLRMLLVQTADTCGVISHHGQRMPRNSISFSVSTPRTFFCSSSMTAAVRPVDWSKSLAETKVSCAEQMAVGRLAEILPTSVHSDCELLSPLCLERRHLSMRKR